MRKLGPISTRKVCGTEMIAVSGLDLVAEVHDESCFGKYVGLHLTPLRQIVGDALITAETDHPAWRLAHDILTPAFTREAMQRYHSIMLGVLDELVERWDAAAERGHSVDVTSDATRLALETIGHTGFGYRFDSLSAHASTSVCQFDEPDAAVGQLVGGPSTGSTVANRAASLRGGVLHSTHPVTGAQLDLVNIRQQVITFLVAGHETTSGALSFALHEAVLTLGMILHRYDLTPEKDYRLKVSESITLKPRGFRLSLRKRTAVSRRRSVDTEVVRRSA